MKKAICLLFLFPLFLTAQDKGLQKENIILKARIDSLESRISGGAKKSAYRRRLMDDL